MEFEYRRPEAERALTEARNVAELEAALQALAGLVADLSDPAIVGHEMFALGLDRTIPVIAHRLGLDDAPALDKSNDHICVIATRLYQVGGHSKVAGDIVNLVGAGRSTVIHTDIYDQLNHERLLNMRRAPQEAKHRADLLLGARSLVGKILELYNILAAIRPSRIFLLTHHFDMVGPIAAWPFRSVVDYLHHADHLPTVAATLPWSSHVDLTWTCHGVCRRAGLDAIYAGLTVISPASSAAAAPALARDKPPGRLRIATCGHVAKYRGSGAWRWVDYAVEALRRPGTELLHFGETDAALRHEITRGLADAGLDPAAYVFAGATPSLAHDLKAKQVDAYLSSYPTTGGKANVEAMSAGLPPVVPLDPGCPPLLRFGFPTDTWIEVASPGQVSRAIDAALAKRAAMSEGVNPVAGELERFDAYVRNPPGATS